MTDIVKRKGGPLKKEIKYAILESLNKLVQQGNAMSVNHQALADKYGAEHNINIKRQTISNLLDQVYKSIPPENVKNIELKIELLYDKMIREAQLLLQKASSQKEKKDAIDLMTRVLDKFIDFLIKAGRKAPVTQNINLQADITQKTLNVQIIDDRRQVIADDSNN